MAVLGGGGGLSCLGFEVGQVGLAEGTLDDVDVEGDVGTEIGVEGVEEEAPELLAVRAGEAAAAPDRTQGVESGIAAVLADVFKAGAELGRVAQRLLDPCQ